MHVDGEEVQEMRPAFQHLEVDEVLQKAWNCHGLLRSQVIGRLPGMA